MSVQPSGQPCSAPVAWLAVRMHLGIRPLSAFYTLTMALCKTPLLALLVCSQHAEMFPQNRYR